MNSPSYWLAVILKSGFTEQVSWDKGGLGIGLEYLGIFYPFVRARDRKRHHSLQQQDFECQKMNDLPCMTVQQGCLSVLL